MDFQPDRSLAASWAAGDERGFTALVDRHAALVHARCRRVLGTADADDATQAVFLVLARRAAAAAAHPEPAAWLMQVADHVVRQALRDHGRRHRAETTFTPSLPEAADPDAGEALDHLKRALAELPATEGDAIRLRYLAGYTLAEVAERLGAPLTTIASRIERGLARLRASLSARGVAAGAAVAALLAGKAEAGMSPATLAHCRSLCTETTGQATTAVVAAHILRWSRTGPIPMTRIAAWCAAGLTAVGLSITPFLRSAETPSPALAAPTNAGTTPKPGAPEPTANVKPTWNAIVVRAADLGRTIARLRAAPEAALLPPIAQEWLDRVAEVGEVSIEFDPDSCYTPEHRAEQQKMAKELKDAINIADAEEQKKTIDALGKNLKAEAETSPEGVVIDQIPTLRGRLTAKSPEAAVLQWLRAPTLEHVIPKGSFSVRPVSGEIHFNLHGNEKWSLRPVDAGCDLKGPTNTTRFRVDGTVATVTADTDAASDLGWLKPEYYQINPSDDLTLIGLAGDPATGSVASTFDVRLSWTKEGLRLSSFMKKVDLPGGDEAVSWVDVERNATSETTSLQAKKPAITLGSGKDHASKPAAIAIPRLPQAAFAGVPADSLVAAAVAFKSGFVSTSPFWKTIHPMTVPFSRTDMRVFLDKESTKPGNPLLITSWIWKCLEQADGQLSLWVQARPFIPAVSASLDTPAEAANALITATGLARRADGSVQIPLGLANATLIHQDGKLWFTTHDQGLAGCRGTGFTDHPEVRAALAEMPKAAPAFALILRPLALSEQLAPLAAVQLPPDAMQRVTAWQQGMRTQGTRGWLHFAPEDATGAAGWRMEASGVMGVVIGAAAAGQLLGPDGPMKLLKAIN